MRDRTIKCRRFNHEPASWAAGLILRCLYAILLKIRASRIIMLYFGAAILEGRHREPMKLYAYAKINLGFKYSASVPTIITIWKLCFMKSIFAMK